MENHCLFCNSSSYSSSYYPSFEFNNKQFNYITCNQCRLVYLSPLLSFEDLKALYSLKYHNEFYFSAGKRYDEQLQTLKKLNLTGKLLDYGCGDGSFLKFFTNQGFDLYGAEYNPLLVNQLTKANPHATFTTIEDILNSDEQKFDIIHLGDVLEHLNNPSEIIDKLKTKLSPDGIFFIEGPIEHNTSFGHFTRTQYHSLRKFLQPNRVIALRPYHVFFANQKNQLQFFQSHHLKTLYYHLFEWAWPYPELFTEAKSISKKIQFMLGYISRKTSALSASCGNRFYYIGRKI